MKAKSPVHLLSKVEEKAGCIQKALHILGDKWSPLLLGSLFESEKTFSELSAELPGISPRTLSARLDNLKESGIIAKKCYCAHPPRFTYGLTSKGHDLRSILINMASWGKKYS